MIIVDPAVEFITEKNPLKRIELCGRVCYKSEDKITEDSARRFVEARIKSGHTSILEHARVVITKAQIHELQNSAYLGANPAARGAMARINYGRYVPTVNVRDYIGFFGTLEEAVRRDATEDDYMTVRFTCDRAISNELVRHRVFSFSQESTRYVNYAGKEMEFVRPLPFDWATQENDMRYISWWNACLNAKIYYHEHIHFQGTPQEARRAT